MAIEIVSFPMKKCWFSIVFCRFTRGHFACPGINRVRFDGNDEIIEAMLSVEGEVVETREQGRDEKTNAWCMSCM